MRAAISLVDISFIVRDAASFSQSATSGILSSFPTVPGGTKLAIFHSPVALFNSQLSVTEQHIRLLQAENNVLKASVKSLSDKSTSLLVEVETLRTQNEKLVDELRVERVQGTARIKKARIDRSKILELESIAKQRDAFIHAMIDINLQQHVLKDAYHTIENGRCVDEAIVSAIQSAARKPTSPWSRILTQPDVTRSDIYKCAIELAAAARLRTDQSVQAARFWRHVAKCDPKNADIITPSPSTLEDMDEDLKADERGNVLDGLLERLRAGEDIRVKKEESRRPLFTRPDTPDETASTPMTSPTMAFFEFYRTDTGRTGLYSSPSYATLSSWNSDFMITFTSGKLQEPISMPIAKRPPVVHLSSLERICGAFAASSFGFLDESESSVDSLIPCEDTLPTSLATGRGRSATVPFAARDLALPPVKNVVSKVPVVTAPGDKEKKAQALAGHKVRLNNGVKPLTRSKAITSRRPRNAVTGIVSSAVRTPCQDSVPDDTPTSGPSCTSSLIKSKPSLPTPPAEADSIRYVRPPTVTRKRVSGTQLLLDTSPATIPYITPSVDSIPSSPSQQGIRRYTVKDPKSHQPRADTTAIGAYIPSTSNSGTAAGSLLSSTTSVPQQKLAAHKTPLKAISISVSNKENIPPKRSSVPVTPARTKPIPSKIPARTPPSSGSSRRKIPSELTLRSPTRPAVTKPVMPVLKPVQPLRIVKKNPATKSVLLNSLPVASISSPRRQLHRLQTSVSPRFPSALPR